MSPEPNTDSVNFLVRVSALEMAVGQSTKAMTNMVEQIGKLAEKMGSLQTLALQHETTGSGLERAFKAIGETNSRLEAAIHEITRSNDSRAEEHIRWRTAHVAENTQTEKTLGRHAAFAGAGVVFIGAIVSLVIYIWSGASGNTSRDIDVIRSNQVKYWDEADKRLDHAEQVLIRLCSERTNPNCTTFR